jgi:hypothetical protein
MPNPWDDLAAAIEAALDATAGAGLTGFADGKAYWADQIAQALHNFDTWHEIGEAGEPAYENSWTVESGLFNIGPSRFRKLSDGTVRLEVRVKRASASLATVFTLPAECRPATEQRWPVIWWNGSAYQTHIQLVVRTTGAVTFNNHDSALPVGVLASVSFPAEQ